MNIKNKKLYLLNQIILLIVLLFFSALLINSVYAKTSDEWGENANMLYEMGDYIGAIESFEKAIEIDPSSTFAWTGKGFSFYQLNRYEEAIISFDKAIYFDQNYALAWVGKGFVLEALGENEEALVTYNRTIVIYPVDAYSLTGKAFAFSKLKRHEEALNTFDKSIKTNPNYARAWIGKGFVFMELNRYDEAINAYDKATEINPNYTWAWTNKGLALEKLSRYGEAIEAYNKALAIDQNQSGIWNNKGLALNKLNQYEEAIKSYDKALAIDQNQSGVWINKGLTFYMLSQHEKAIKAYNRAIAINPDYRAWTGKGLALDKLDQYEEAIEAYNKALDIYSDSDLTWRGKGDAHYMLGQYGDAIEAYDRALAIDQNQSMVWNNKGYALEKLSRYEEAINAYKKAIDIDPNNSVALNNEDRMFEMQSQNESDPFLVTSFLIVVTLLFLVVINIRKTQNNTIQIDDEDNVLSNLSKKQNEATNNQIDNANNIHNTPKLSKLSQQRLKGINQVLHGENIVDGISGTIFFDTNEFVNGLVVLTTTDIILHGGKHPSRKLQISDISNVTFNSGLLMDSITFHLHHNDIKIRNISKKENAKKLTETVESYISDWKKAEQKKLEQEKEVCDSIELKIDVPNPLKLGVETPIKITINNPTETQIFEIQLQSKISTLVKCDKTTTKIKTVPPKSSKYTAIFITPRIADEIDLGNLDVSFEISGNTYEKEPIAIGTYEVVDVTSSIPMIHADDIASDLSISRETEFYQGYIRLKMSVTNTSTFVVNDVSLDFDFDDNLLRIDRHEPNYKIKNSKIIFGNISGNSSKTVAVYFDPMMCSKGTDINCQINYKDAKGQIQTTRMEPKQISVVCPIMETESDINIGRLKEFIEKLPHKDSKVYQIQTGFAIDKLKNVCREVIQKHDVKHIRTLSTKNEGICEIWYYGKTKVNSHDIVIRITISSETQSIELFAATQTAESLTGLLAEVGRELKGAIEKMSTAKGNVQQVINVSIKDSIIQRSNLLSFCDIDGNCIGDVVIEDSLVRRSTIGFDVKTDNRVNIPVQTSFDDSNMKNEITENTIIPNKETSLKKDNLDKMNKYGAAALKSVKLLQSDKNKNPIEVWDIATKEILKSGTPSQKKGCPKNTFLGLCEEGLIRGVQKGNYTNSKENKKYALKAVEILKKKPHLASNQNALWNEVVDEPKVHNSQMDVVIALWNNDFINKLDVVSIIKKRFAEVGNPAQIPLLRSDGSFKATLSDDGIRVDNLGNSPFLPWDVFVESVSHLGENGGRAKRGNASGSKNDGHALGDNKLPLDSIEGHIAHVVYGKQVGDSIFRRITPIACILIWAKICQHKTGELLLSDNYVMMGLRI